MLKTLQSTGQIHRLFCQLKLGFGFISLNFITCYHLHAHIYPADCNEQMDNRTFQVTLQKPDVNLNVSCPNTYHKIKAACLKNLIFPFSFTLSDNKCALSPLNLATTQQIAFCQHHNLMNKALYERLDGLKGCSECANWDIITLPLCDPSL